MRVAVTGASGFIGKALVQALLERGDSVTAFSRRPDGPGNPSPKCQSAMWPPEGEFPAVDAVIHLAGEPVTGRWTPGKKQAIKDSRVDGTRVLLDAMSGASERPSAFISASATGYYGDRGEERLTESAEAGSDFLADVCKAWEAEAAKAEDLGLRVAMLRTCMVIASEGPLQSMLPAFRMGLGGPIGSGLQWFPWIHRDDIVRLYLHLLDTDIDGPVNGVAPEAVRQGDFAKALGTALHRPAFLPTPRFALRLAVGEFGDTLFHSQRVLPEKAKRNGFEFKYPTLPEALAASLA